MTIETDIKAVEKKVGVFITAHHAVLYVLLIAAGLFGVYEIESKYAAIETARANSAQQALAVEKDHSAQLTAAFQTAQAQRDKENQQFLATIQTLQSQAKVQIVHDQALPAPELGHRIENLTNFKQDSITLDSANDLIVPLPLARDIVTRLDQGQADAQTVVQQNSLIVNQQKTITDQNGVIVEDKIVLTKQIDSDQKILSAEKAKGRKGKLKWFGIGFVTGFIAREIIKP